MANNIKILRILEGEVGNVLDLAIFTIEGNYEIVII